MARLEHEVAAEAMVTTSACNPDVVTLQPSLHLGNKPHLTAHRFKVDFAFGSEDDNNTVCSAVASPLVDLALRVSSRGRKQV
jgi:hypothetical protein